MERVKRFTVRDVFANKYTIVNNRLVLTKTETFADYFGRVVHKWLNTRDSNLSDFL